MEQGPLVQQPLALQTDYPLSSDHDGIDHFNAHTHHTSPYANAGALEQMRRDGSLSQQAPGIFTYTPANNQQATRFMSERSVASDANSYSTTQHFTDSSSGSTSTSPSSAASSVAYTNYQPNHYTTVPTFPGAVQQQQLPQGFLPSSYGATRVSSILDGTASTMLPPPQRSSISTFIHPGDRDAYVTSNSLLSRNQLSPSIQNGYASYPDTPRSLQSSANTLSLASPGSGYSHMANTGGYGSTQSECANFPWPNLEVLLELTCDGQAVTPEVHAKVEKGFFLSTVDQKWTCYRRNYFSVQCNFELHPNINNGRMYLKRNNTSEPVQAMGMRLSAAVDGSGGKSIELIQHTPKRDNGPKTKIDVTKVSPTPPSGRGDHTISPHGVYGVPMHTFHPTGSVPGPYLPLQNLPGENSMSNSLSSSQPLSAQMQYGSAGHLPLPGQTTQHTFERVQFKQATANNGKRRASQQYFHLIVELFADVRQETSDQPVWVKVAQRVSEKIVVRGRSPSHYQNEGQGGTAAGGRGGSTSNGGSVYGNSNGNGPTYSGMNAGGFRSSGGYNSMSNGSGYHNRSYDLQASPEHNSGSSPESILHDQGGLNADNQIDAVPMTEAERAGIQDHPGYQYFASPIFEAGLGPQQYSGGQSNRIQPTTLLPPLAKVESNARFTTGPRSYAAVKPEYSVLSSDSTGSINTSITDIPVASGGNNWQVGGCGRYQGSDSSRGFFPSEMAVNYS